MADSAAQMVVLYFSCVAQFVFKIKKGGALPILCLPDTAGVQSQYSQLEQNCGNFLCPGNLWQGPVGRVVTLLPVLIHTFSQVNEGKMIMWNGIHWFASNFMQI